MRKRKDFVRLEGVRSARLVVIASEGRCTESNYDATRLLPHASTAMEIARELDVNTADRWPQTVGTRVYKLMESITELKTDIMLSKH